MTGPGELLEVEQVGGATVVRFRRRTILDPSSIRAVGDRLLELTDGDGARAVVLNFAGVESLTSATLGAVAALNRRLGEAGGRLAFCRVEPFLMQIFHVVRLPDHIPVYADEAQAVQAVCAAPA